MILFAAHSLRAQATLQIVNNFNPGIQQGADYFGHHYDDSEVWLFFLNTYGAVTYTDSHNVQQTVADATALKLSDIKNGSFSIGTGSVSTKVFAGLGSTNPFTGVNGPGLFDTNVPYALTEWTINGNANDNIDVSYEDSFSYPTRLTVKNSSGTTVGQAGFKAGTQAQDVINKFKEKISSSPVGPANANYPGAGSVGYGPLVPTIEGDANAQRWIGSSKFWISGPGVTEEGKPPLRSLYTYAPSFNNYLAHLKENTPTTSTSDGLKTGWYIDYSGNGGYSAFVEITGNAEDGYGIHIHSIRVNTNPSAANDWKADPNAGDATTGTITITANGATVPFIAGEGPDGTNVVGQWTDAVIYSGASLLNGDFATGPIVTANGDFALDGAHHDIVATLLASISASMATGLLGSDLYTNALHADDPKGTMYWFNTLPHDEALAKLFESAWEGGEEFYDPYWAILAELTEIEGYLSPFNDRWSNFNTDFEYGEGYTAVWELGVLNLVPEPAAYAGIAALCALGATCLLRRRKR